MTNNWTDMGNSSCFIVMGANPVENHPASIAHINIAREKGARLIVIDPRQTRTARQIDESKGDRYIRIRPGTDIAFINSVVKTIIEKMETVGSKYGPTGVEGETPVDVPASVKTKFFEFLNRKDAGTFFTDDAAPTAVAVPSQSKYTDACFVLTSDGSDYDREKIVAATGAPVVGGEAASTTISNFPKKAATVDGDTNTVYNRLKAHVAPYTQAVAADICGCTAAEIEYVADAYIANSRCSSPGGFGAGAQDPRVEGYKATTMLYAMGLTQHSHGSQNVKSFAVVQTLMGNMGRAGGGINALRGIHNVQGSTDMGLLYHLIPGYSGNPTVMPSADANAFGKYMDGLWGNPVSGTGGRASMDNSYDDAYNTAAGVMGLQQRGFYNMTLKWFGDYTAINAEADPAVKRSKIDAIYALWPKTNGDDHITMFRRMAANEIKGAVVWGQNPAVTEPNQSKVRDGLEALDILVCVDLFENETAACKRKDGSVTYLIPASSHIEEAGSVTNSGRVLQWRQECVAPKGNSKTDLELLLRFAKALDTAGAFSHISAVWDTIGVTYTSVYDKLYGAADQYGWAPGAAFSSETVAEAAYIQMCTPTFSGGAMWIYTGGYDANLGGNKHTGQANWAGPNRAKNRDNSDPNGTLAYPGWGYAWLVNRRVLYNNGEIPGEVADFFMGPDSAARLFVSTSTAVLNYSRWYRKVHNMADRPDRGLGGNPHVLPGRFPAHTEPYESPRDDLVAKFGHNTANGAALLKADTARGTAAEYPLVLTTIRCVEHFQGGPITRNNAWNHEVEPEPWVEINALDAIKYGIKNGDWVNVVTARSNSTTDQQSRTNGAAGFAKGFRARVGVGVQSNQRVGQGVVAIPWHWGDRGLSTGSRANDLCIDAFDANTRIPEYKACLCRIEKA